MLSIRGSMARNIEIKAHIDDIGSITRKAAALADKGPFEIIQDDTFFTCPNGRLKLRAFSRETGELIFYRRPDQAGPKESFYLISPTSTPDILREVLTQAYGPAGRVRKCRTLFLAGQTRIHLDRVEDLGDFMELEVVLSEGDPIEAGETIARDIMEKLGISSDQLIERAYVDLLNEKRTGRVSHS
jgi:adenylate cyclase class IV